MPLRQRQEISEVLRGRVLSSVEHPCLGCGACCAALRVDFHVSDAPADGRGVPVEMVVALTATLRRMRGTDEAPPRCIALRGVVGSKVCCAIYPSRPSPCRDFAPFAAIGIGDEACDRARRRHGMAPLQVTEVAQRAVR